MRILIMNDTSQTWLRKLVNSQPAFYWPWRHSLRLALITTVPLTIGWWTGHLAAALFMCLGGLLSAVSVQTDPYWERFPRIFIAVPFGVCGFFWGAFIAGHGYMTIAGVVLAALVSGWISFWGKAFSAGSLQMLVMSVVAAHLPPAAISWTLPVLFGCGALYAASLLYIEALLIPKQPERKLTALVFSSLAELARVGANHPPNSAAFKAALHTAMERQGNAYAVIMGLDVRRDPGATRGTDDGFVPPNSSGTQAPAAGDGPPSVGHVLLATVDRLTVLIALKSGAPPTPETFPAPTDARSAAGNNRANLLLLAQALDALSHYVAVRHAKPLPPCVAPSCPQLAQAVQTLYAQTQLPLVFERHPQAPLYRRLATDLSSLRQTGLRAQFEAQRSNFINILSLALCMFIAMIAEFHLPGNRSYWIPLSVAVILKPDFGSVFVRAVQRSLGTLVGVLLAVLIFYAVPKGLWLVLVVGALSAIIPWATLKNYAWQCSFLTPLILILIDLIIAGPSIDYGPQRLIDTLLGAAIVLVFGYCIWPKPVIVSFAARQDAVRTAIVAYCAALESLLARDHLPPVQAATPEGGGVGRGDSAAMQGDAYWQSLAVRHTTYAQIFALQKWVQGFLAEPPPASAHAHVWLATMATAQSLVDRLDCYMVQCEVEGHSPDPAVLADFSAQAKQWA